MNRSESLFQKGYNGLLTGLTALFLALLAPLNAEELTYHLEPFEPVNGEKLINYHPHFEWRGPEMTLDYQPECEIQIATDPEFKKLEVTDVIGGGMNRFYSVRSLTELRDYFWHVRIKKPNPGPWSQTFRFTVVAPEQRFEIERGSNSARVLENMLPPRADASLPGLSSAIFRCLVMIITTQATSLTTS